MPSFSEYKENAKPQGLKTADLASSKEAFCIAGQPELIEGSYEGKPTIQHRVDIIHLIDGKRNSESVFMPGSKFFQNFFAGLSDHPQFKHNLYLYKDGKAYDIGQRDGVCPCKHGSNGKASQEADSSVSHGTQTDDDADFFTPDGEEVKLSVKPASITHKQVSAYYTLCSALRQEPAADDVVENWSEQQADKAILRLRALQASGNGKVKSTK